MISETMDVNQNKSVDLSMSTQDYAKIFIDLLRANRPVDQATSLANSHQLEITVGLPWLLKRIYLGFDGHTEQTWQAIISPINVDVLSISTPEVDHKINCILERNQQQPPNDFQDILINLHLDHAIHIVQHWMMYGADEIEINHLYKFSLFLARNNGYNSTIKPDVANKMIDGYLVGLVKGSLLSSPPLSC